MLYIRTTALIIRLGLLSPAHMFTEIFEIIDFTFDLLYMASGVSGSFLSVLHMSIALLRVLGMC